jgi:hypothetical protein
LIGRDKDKYDLGLVSLDALSDPVDPNPTHSEAGNQVSGFVWLDNNGDGLQSTGEPGFYQTIAGVGPVSVALYPQGSDAFIAVKFLDEASDGRYVFENVPAGQYYMCTNTVFDLLGLSVTTQHAGNDAINNDFDDTPCSYDITVSNSQGVKRDLGLAGDLNPAQPVDPAPTDPVSNETGNLSDIVIKTDAVLINHQWRAVDDAFNSSDAVIFYSAPSSNGAQRGVARMRRINNGRPEFKFQEWSNLDGFHANETINVVSIQQGQWQTENTRIEVGLTDINGTGQWKTIQFAQPYAVPPTVILNVQSANGVDAVDVRARHITTESMQIALFEEQSKMQSGHKLETVGYLIVASRKPVIELNNAELTRIVLPFGSNGIGVDHQWRTIGSGLQIRLEEDQTSDQETHHRNEIVHVVKINDVYLTQIASSNGSDPGVLRSR